MTIGSVKFTGAPGVENPQDFVVVRASDGAAGFDVKACRVLDKETKNPCGELPAVIEPGEVLLVGIGVIIAVPKGYKMEVLPRSGLAALDRIELGNSPGLVDSDFRGEVGILLCNRGLKPFTVVPKMRIAQLVFGPVVMPDLIYVPTVADLGETRRGSGGFGSTGLMGHGLGTEAYDATVRSLDLYFMRIAIATAERSDCVRGCQRGPDGEFPRDEYGRLIGQTRRYGCVIAHGDRVIATGYNHQYPGAPLCAEKGCLRDEEGIPSGQQLERCRAIHAEQAAVNSAARTGAAAEGATMYTNSVPCLACARIIAGLGLEALVVLEGSYSSDAGLEIVREAGVRVRSITLPTED